MKRADWKPVLFVVLLIFSVMNPATSFGQVLPSNLFKGNSASTIDIDVTYISRSPRYDYEASKNAPAVGDSVTFTAHIRSRGTSATGNFAYKWYIDGSEVATGVVSSLNVGAQTTVNVQYTWQAGNHTLSFFADPSNAIVEKSEQNNLRNEYINALLVGFWVEQSVYNFFDANQYAYSRKHDIGDEANSWEDWAQRQMAKWNEMLKTAVFPSTPQGCLDRVRLDQVIVVADGALPLNGGLPTNHPDTRDKTIDMMWGFEKDILSTGFYNTNSSSSPFNLEPGLIHELNHARYLVDSYALNVHGKHIAVLDDSGRRIYPNNDTFVRENSQAPGLMSNTIPQYAEWEAAGLNVYAGQRPLPGWANVNAHAGLGVYLENKMPRNNYLRVIDLNGKLVSNAIIEVYQGDTWPWEWHWYPKYIDATVDGVGATDKNGLFALGSNPFSQEEPIGGWDFFRCINFFKIKYASKTFYRWLDIAQVHVEYFRGNQENAYYDMMIEVNTGPGPTNQPPTVFAGLDTEMTLPDQLELSGVATDDGLPNPPGTVTTLWSKASGPGNVTFSDATALVTTVSFSTYGTYVLRLSANDGILHESDDITVEVNPDPSVVVELIIADIPTMTAYLGRSSTYLQQAQSFKAIGPLVSRVTVALTKYGSPTQDVTISLRTQVKTGDLASVRVPAGAITSTDYRNPTWIEVKFPEPMRVTPEKTYLVAVTTGAMSSRNYYLVCLSGGNPYRDGYWYKNTIGNLDTTYDMLMKIGFGGTGNEEPTKPTMMSGTQSGVVGTSYAFSATAQDPDGDRVSFVFDWGDGQITTSGLVSSGATVTESHTWQTEGPYAVTVRAVDEHNTEGPWSDPYTVTIAALQHPNTPPGTPTSPDGPETGVVGDEITLTASATDAEGDAIRLVVDWGDGNQETTNYEATGTPFSLSHTWQSAGIYDVRVQAVDEHGAASPWSAAAEIEIQVSGLETLVISDRPTGGWYLGSAYSRKRQAQSFKTIGTRILGASVALSRVGSPTQPIQVSIRSTLTGTPLASAEIQPSQVSSTDYRYQDWITVNFATPAQVTEGSTYYLVLEVASYDSSKYYKVGYNSTNPYAYGVYYPASSSTAQSALDMACKIVFVN